MHKQTKPKRKKKTHFNIFKFLRNMGSLFIVIFIIYWVINGLFIHTSKQLPNIANAPEKKVVTPVPVPVNPIIEYKAKQYKILINIFRFNQNLYMYMDTDNVVNIYPDSQNAITALNNNLSTFSNKLNSADITSESSFLAQLTLKNDAFINSVIAYNNVALSKSPNSKTLENLKENVQKNYDIINKFMNDNLSLFK